MPGLTAYGVIEPSLLAASGLGCHGIFKISGKVL